MTDPHPFTPGSLLVTKHNRGKFWKAGDTFILLSRKGLFWGTLLSSDGSMGTHDLSLFNPA